MRCVPTLAVLLALCPAAMAEEISWFAGATASTMVIDRGEQLAGNTLEAEFGLETSIGGGTAYAALYRITPIGGDQAAFDDEFDYTLGYAFEGSGWAGDVSANWLTFPGEETESSLELAGEIALDAPFAPTLAGFYDVDLEDWGLEASAGPEWPLGDWTAYAVARVGFVEPGDGSATRSYGGLEAGAARALTEQVEIGGFVRFETADEDAFADEISGGEVTQTRSEGLSIGISLSIAG